MDGRIGRDDTPGLPDQPRRRREGVAGGATVPSRSIVLPNSGSPVLNMPTYLPTYRRYSRYLSTWVLVGGGMVCQSYWRSCRRHRKAVGRQDGRCRTTSQTCSKDPPICIEVPGSQEKGSKGRSVSPRLGRCCAMGQTMLHIGAKSPGDTRDTLYRR